MPRRSGGRSMSGRSAPAPAAPVHHPPAPVHHPPAPVHHAPPAHPPPKQPGLFGQMAATAGGVAIGSAVGHTIGHALTGGGGGGGSAQPAPAAAAPAAQSGAPPAQSFQQQQQQPEVCGYELEQFLACAKNQDDLTLCQGFKDSWKQCYAQNGMY